jgi:threonine dehydrogenase-like Zn-dependent dehydrogenase
MTRSTGTRDVQQEKGHCCRGPREAADPRRSRRGHPHAVRHPATLHLEDQWTRDITITTGLVDAYSTPTLLRLLASHHIDAGRFVAHRFALDEFDKAYDVFARPADTGALKVVLSRSA